MGEKERTKRGTKKEGRKECCKHGREEEKMGRQKKEGVRKERK